jgi:peptide/nickel transport system permease protein
MARSEVIATASRMGGKQASVASWITFVAKRLVIALPVLVCMSVVNFTVIHLAPGDPAEYIAGTSGASTPEILAELRAEFGLDKPWLVQLGIYLGHVLRGDLGRSHAYRLPVFELIVSRIPATLLLMVTAMVGAAVLGILLGVLAAVFRRSWVGDTISAISVIVHATPVFWVGLMLIVLFSVRLEWFPAFGMAKIATSARGLAYAAEVLHHLVLPATTLGMFYMTLYLRLMRTNMLDILTHDYITVARSKGLSESTVYLRHAARNAVLPVVTVAGMQMAQVLGGSVVVETVFAWPGLGRLMFDAVLQRDYPVLLGGLLMTGAMVVLSNIVTDAAYRVVDPRIRAA